MHNLQLTDDQSMILDTVKKFVGDAVVPKVLDLDEQRQFAGAELAGLGELGLFGLSLPEASGGAGMGLLPLAVACEEIGAVSGSLARLLAGQVQSGLALVPSGAAPLDEVLGGEKIAAYVGPEYGVVSTGGELRGACELVTGAGEADVLVVVAAVDDQPALHCVEVAAVDRTELRSLGFASAAPARVTFDAVAAAPLATGADAAAAIAAADLAGWIAGAAVCIGMGRASIELARKHAGERIAFGKPLRAQQAVGRKLVESGRAIEAARHLTYHAARLADLGEDATCSAMSARIAAVDAAILASDEGIQIHGGFGFTVEYHVERHYRDAKTAEVLDGGSDALRDRLAAMRFGD